MADTAEESRTNGFQISDLVEKKKKKRKRLDRETHGQLAGTGFRLPLSSDHPSILSRRFDDQASEGSQTPQKKSKKKARQERSDSQLDDSCIKTESELTGKAEIGVDKPKKKKKRKPGPSEPDDGDWLWVPLSQGKASSQPRADGLGNGDWTDGGTPVKKKRAKSFVAKQDEASKVSAGPMKNRTEPTSSDKHVEAGHSSAEDSQVELFTSSLWKTQHSTLSQEKAATKLSTSTELGSPIAGKKPRKHKKSGVEDSDNTDVTPREPHKHKKSSGVEDSDNTNVTPTEPRKHKKSSGVEESDSTSITPEKSHKDKKSSGVKDSDNTDVTPREPRKHKKSSRVEESDSTSITPGKSHKHKKSSGVEDSDNTSVTPRKPHKHKKSSGMEDSDNTDVILRKSHKHKKSSGVEDVDNTDVTPREPHKHKKSGVEDSDIISVTPRKPHKHKKSSGMEDSESTDITPREPRKHKKSSGVEDSDSTSNTPGKSHEHKKSSGVEDSDSTDITPREPRKHKKSSSVEESDSTSVTPRKPHKHKKSSGVEDSHCSDIGFEAGETVSNHGQIKNESRATHVPLEDTSESPKIPKDVGKSSSRQLPASQSFVITDNEYLDSSELVLPDLDTATQELEEFIPHVRNLSDSAIKQLARRDLIRFKNFKQKGVAVKFGKFTKTENDQLRKNVEAFLQESGIESAEKLLFAHRFPEEKAAIHKLKAKHLFGIRIAEGIPRPWRLVYYRARKIFDPNNYSGRYTDKEKRKLLEYQALYGNNWKKISELMSRSSHSVALKYSQIKSETKTGPWSKEETKRLMQAVEETLQANCKESGSVPEEEGESKAPLVVRENLYKGIKWMNVEAKVGTRHWRQCKQKWISVVTKKMSRGQVMAKGRQNVQFKINLIERLYELNIEDANEVDWEALSSIIGDVPPDYIQKRFYRLKSTHVPFWNQKTFPEIIDHLYEVTLPKLKALLKSKKAKNDRVKEQRKVFQFQDIFRESCDELLDDSSDEQKAEEAMSGSESF